MQNVTINTNGNINLLNAVSSSDFAVTYSLPFNYLDGQVDFYGSQINNNDYALGYSYDTTPVLTHFNGADSCSIGLFWTNAYPATGNDTKYPLIRNFCHIKTKYISISSTSLTIEVTSLNTLFADSTNAWEINGNIKTMVKTSLPNAKYFLTSNVADNFTGGGTANTKPLFNGNLISGGQVFPMYFPKRDTLILKDNYLNQG